MRVFLLVATSVLLSTFAFSQVTTIDFETANDGYTPSGTEGSGFTDVFNRANPNIGGNSTFLWAVEDINLSDPSIDLDQIDVSGSTSFTFAIDMIAHHYNDWDNSDWLEITYSLDGGGYQNLMWVKNNGGTFNELPSLDTDFDGVGDCGAGTLPALTTGTSGCSTSSDVFATFSTAAIPLSSNSTLDIKLQFSGMTSTDEGIYLDNIVITETGSGCTPPTNQASTSSTSNVSTTSETISWTGGTGANSLVVLKEGSAVAGTPSNSTTYSASAVFGGGDEITSGEEVVYASNGSSVTVTGLNPGNTYYYAIFEYDGGAGSECYLTASPETGSFTMPLPACTTAVTQVSSFTFSNVGATSIDVSFGTVSADSFIVVRSTASSLSSNPNNSVSYNLGSGIGGGTVVYNGNGTSLPFTDSGLSASTTYYYFIYAFNNLGCSGGPLYLTPAYSDNATTTAALSYCTNETFANVGPYGGYQTETWTGDDGYIWTATDARTDQSINGSAITVRNGSLTSSSVPGGIGDLTVTTQLKFSGSSGTFDLLVNGVSVGSIPYSSSVQTTTISGINISGNVVIEMSNNSSSNRVAIDDLSWTCYSGGPEPEIDIQGNGVSIAAGDVTPVLSDDTDFGDALLTGGIVTRVYTVFNTGTSDLNLTGSLISGATAAGFTFVSTPTPAVITPGDSLSFAVQFDPSVQGTTGLKQATITLNNNDSNEDPYTFLVQVNVTDIPNIVLSSASPAVVAGNILADSDVDNTVIYAFDLTVSNFDAELTAFDFTTSGTYAAGNITNFKAWYSADNIFNSGSDVFLNNITSSLGTGSHSFSGFSQMISNGTTGNIFITADLPCGATDGNTIVVDAITTADLTFTNGNKSGSAFVGGIQTITEVSPNDVTGFATANCANGGVDLSWTDATGCLDNYIVIASLSSLVTPPSGDGSSYTDDSNYGNGTSYDDGYVVYKGAGTSVSLTGLTNGTNYTYTIYTRNGNSWSNGVEINCTPGIPIPDDGCGTSEVVESITYVGTSTVDDINVFVSIEHTWRADINIEIESPTGTIVQLFDGSNSGLEDNLEVIFDDAGAVISNANHTLDGLEDETVTSDVDLLAAFNGESADGSWTIRICDDAGGDTGKLLDWSIDITEACTPVHTVTSISPDNGPIGTTVEISGTGFTAGTTVNFDGTPSGVVFNSANSLSVVVPSGANSGTIEVVESSCAVQSPVFTVIGGPSGTCTGSLGNFTDIIISEVYDADLNNVWYLELFNPTASPIDLAAGDYEIDRYASDTSSTPSRTIDLTGTIPAGGVYVLNLGTSGNTCTYPWDFSESGSGINADDRNVLTKGGVDLDAVSLPNETGYSVRRLGSASGPTATYNAADWDILLNEDCADLGVAPVLIYSNPTVSDINDISACELDFEVVVDEGDSSTVGDLSYTWYFNDGSNTWTQVTGSAPPDLTILGESTNNLLIGSGAASMSSIAGYQFYVEVVEDASCINTSNAATFEFAPEPFFRTKGGGASQGSWNDVTMWEMSSDLVSWSNACDYPTAGNSDTIIIQASDSIAVVDGVGAPDVLADQLYIASGGLLEIGEVAELNIENSASGVADLKVDGTLIDRSSSGAGNGLTFVNSATWELGTGGTVIKTYNSSVNTYRDNYEGGISSIPSTANWAYVYTGQGDVAVSTIDMYYPNLHFESTAGNYDAIGFNEIFKGVTGFTTVKGDLNIGVGAVTGSSSTYKVYYNNFNPQGMIIEGDLHIGAGSEFTNSSYDGGSSASHDNGVGLELKGGALIDGILDMSADTGKIVFSGTGLQSIFSTNSGTFTCQNLIVNNAADVNIDDIDLTVHTKLIFSDGKIITDISKADMVVLTNDATDAIVGANAAGASKYIEGKLQWTTDGSSQYTFPVGDATVGAQGFEIAVTGSAASEILGFLEPYSSGPTRAYAYCDLETHPGGGTVNAGNGSAGFDGVLDQVEFNLNSPRQWDITNPGGGISSYNLTVLANGSQDINPVTTANGIDVRYLMKDGEPGNPGVSTTLGAPSFNVLGYDACPNQYSLTGLTSFSNFNLIGATQSNTALPVELISFRAQAVNNEFVQCSWSTATEINNDYFTVERSQDGENFEKLADVDGAGNSNSILTYAHTDNEPHRGISYYRLKQTDFDGTIAYSQIVPVNLSDISIGTFTVYPVPFANNLHVVSNTEEQINASMYDIKGSLILSDSFMGSKQFDLSSLAPGNYIVRLSTLSHTETIRVVKK